jgi:hypothetical protein
MDKLLFFIILMVVAGFLIGMYKQRPEIFWQKTDTIGTKIFSILSGVALSITVVLIGAGSIWRFFIQ